MSMLLQNLDLNLLVVLDVLLEEKNITRAGKRSFLSQPATSVKLARLRDYFKDELLIPVGHNEMDLTPLAKSLVDPVRDVLRRVNNIINARPGFDPATSTRRFRFVMSDYFVAILMTAAMPRIQQLAPFVGIEILNLDDDPDELLDRGEADFIGGPERFLSPAHPSDLLILDTYVCVVWSGNEAVADRLTADQYFSLPHVSMHFGPRTNAYENWIFQQTGRSCRVAVIAQAYSLLPHLVVGTNCVATMHRLLARMYAGCLPIRIAEPPIPMPAMTGAIQYHRDSASDPGIAWMRKVLRETAEKAMLQPQEADIVRQ